MGGMARQSYSEASDKFFKSVLAKNVCLPDSRLARWSEAVLLQNRLLKRGNDAPGYSVLYDARPGVPVKLPAEIFARTAKPLSKAIRMDRARTPTARAWAPQLQ